MNIKLVIKSILYLLICLLLNATEALCSNVINNTVRYSKGFAEKTYILTDREIYIAGDYLFFKLYVVDEATLQPSLKSKIAYLSFRNNKNKSISDVHVNLQNGMAYGCLYLPDTLKTDYYQILSFTNAMRNGNVSNFAKREIFCANQFDKEGSSISIPTVNSTINLGKDTSELKKPISFSLKSRSESILKIKTDKTSYLNREKINLSVLLNGVNVNEIADLTVTAYELAPEILNHKDICDQFELHNYENSNLADFNVSYNKLKEAGLSDDKAKEMANELIQKKQSQTNNTICRYIPELQGEILQGIVMSVDENKVVPAACVFLSTSDSSINLKYSIADGNGMFRFLLDDFYSGKELNLKVRGNDVNMKYKIVFENKFDFKQNISDNKFNYSSLLRDFIVKSQNITKINKVYHSVLIENDTLPISASNSYHSYPRVISVPSTIVRPSDFLALPDFIEIARELLPTLRLRKKDGIYVCNFFNSTLNAYFENSPAIFLDGIFIDDINQIIGLNSQQIKSIECTNKPRVLGNLSFDGIIAVYTKKHESEHIKISNNTKILSEASLPVSKFHNPNNAGNPTLPDFRQLLYWNPSFRLIGNSSKTLELTASDNNGLFVIKVEGITTEGHVISAYTNIKIESLEK